MDKIISRLNNEGWSLYLNANNCGFCHKQLRSLGSYIQDLNIIHCDSTANKTQCSECRALPCWDKQGKKIRGARLSVASLEHMLDSN